MPDDLLEEQVLRAWVALNGTLKDSQMTKGLTYNEAIVMLLILEQYRRDGVGRTSVQHLLKSTNFLKSLMNRTVNALCIQGYLQKERVGRQLFVAPLPQRLPDFLAVHNHSLSLARQVIDAIGQEDAQNFVRICEKLMAADLKF